MPQIACPSCGAVLTIPASTSIDSFRCPRCQKMLRLNRRSNPASSKAEATSAPLSTEPAHTTLITINESLLPPKMSAARRLGEWMRPLVNRANSSPLINKARKAPRIVKLGIVLACIALAFGGWQFRAWIPSDPVSYDDFFDAYSHDRMASVLANEGESKEVDEIARMSDVELRLYTRRRAIAIRQLPKFWRRFLEIIPPENIDLELLRANGETIRDCEKAAKIYERIGRYGLTREGEKKLRARWSKP